MKIFSLLYIAFVPCIKSDYLRGYDVEVNMTQTQFSTFIKNGCLDPCLQIFKDFINIFSTKSYNVDITEEYDDFYFDDYYNYIYSNQDDGRKIEYYSTLRPLSLENNNDNNPDGTFYEADTWLRSLDDTYYMDYYNGYMNKNDGI